MKITKKIFTLLAIFSVLALVGLLIMLLFGINLFAAYRFKLIISFAITAVASGFIINSINYMKIKRTISLVNFILLIVTTALVLISFWVPGLPKILQDTTLVLAITTIFFVILVSNSLKLGNKHKALQIITGILVVFIDIVIILSIFGVDVFNLFPQFMIWFITACLVAFALLCTCAILGKKSPEATEKVIIKEVPASGDDRYMTISKVEYEGMLAQIKRLQEENEVLKNK